MAEHSGSAWPTPIERTVIPLQRRGMTAEQAAVRNTFEFDDGNYDPDEFYVASTNAHDHSETIQLKVPKHVKVLVNQFIADANIPAYKSQNDVWRDALVHRLHHLQTSYQVPAELRHWISVETARCAMETMKAERRAAQEVAETVAEMIDVAREDNDPATMHQIAVNAAPMVQAMREPGRTRLVDKLRAGWAIMRMDLEDLDMLLAVDAEMQDARAEPLLEVQIDATPIEVQTRDI